MDFGDWAIIAGIAIFAFLFWRGSPVSVAKISARDRVRLVRHAETGAFRVEELVAPGMWIVKGPETMDEKTARLQKSEHITELEQWEEV